MTKKTALIVLLMSLFITAVISEDADARGRAQRRPAGSTASAHDEFTDHLHLGLLGGLGMSDCRIPGEDLEGHETSEKFAWSAGLRLAYFGTPGFPNLFLFDVGYLRNGFEAKNKSTGLVTTFEFEYVNFNLTGGLMGEYFYAVGGLYYGINTNAWYHNDNESRNIDSDIGDDFGLNVEAGFRAGIAWLGVNYKYGLVDVDTTDDKGYNWTLLFTITLFFN